MTTNVSDALLCSLCGEPISPTPEVAGDVLSMDHVPPKQFYPREVRKRQGMNLWLVPTHRRCNEDYRKDEEYFCHAAYVLVRKGNRQMGPLIHRDLMRRRHKPQTPAMARTLLKAFKIRTDGGIHLPPGIMEVNLDAYRIQRVALKISQGLFYRDYERYLPRQNCRDIRLCVDESEVPELYQLSWRGADEKAALRGVFSYRRFEFDNLHLFSMFFWKAFMFCTAFESPWPINPQPARPGHRARPAAQRSGSSTLATP